MHYGVVFPQTEFGNDPDKIRDYAQTAEALGYDYFLAYDHVLGADPNRSRKLTGPYTHQDPFHEPMVLFGFLAAVTKRLQLTTGILILPQRQTVLVAKQAAEVDVLSGGRLRLGVGLGWNHVEYDALGMKFETRGKRMGEQIELLRKLWTAPLVTHRSDQNVIDNAGLNPMPIQRPIPIWFGGAADAALRRVAKFADGWIASGRTSAAGAKPFVEQLNRFLIEAGRDPNSFGKDTWVSIANSSPEEWRKRVDEWRTLGGTHIAVDTMRAGFKTPQEHIDAIRKFRDVLA
jgi:probable F420-dependent oxidoreductase